MSINKPKEVPILEEDDDYEDEYYDSRGNVTPGGLYDAGGHLITERYMEYADYIRDRMRDEGM
jgi:hypothetical protein